jgi:hypothetical protein
MPCLVVLLVLAFPRVVLLVMALTSDYLQRAYANMLLPIVGFFVLPVTTLAYAWMKNSGQPVDGIGMVVMIIAVLIDVGGIGGGGVMGRRRRI